MQAGALAGLLSLISILTLLLLLIMKEITSSSQNDQLKRLGKMLNIGILPLILVFLLSVFFRVIDVLK